MVEEDDGEQQQNKRQELSTYYKLVKTKTTPNKFFKTDRHRYTYEFQAVEEAADPEDVLRQCFREAIDAAITESRTLNGEPDNIGITIDSTLLLHGAIWVPFSTYTSTEAVVEETLRFLNRVNQSGSEERGNLFGGPFTFDVTTICSKCLREENTVNGGAPMVGRGADQFKKNRKVDPTVDHNLAYRGLIRIRKPDNLLCLFMACEMARRDKTERNGRAFRTYKGSIRRQTEAAKELMAGAKIPVDMDGYDAKIWLPVVQTWYDVLYPGQFRFYIFEQYGRYKPTFKTGAFENRQPLCLFYDGAGEHFDVISSMSSFLGSKRSYCWSCEVPYK